MDVLSLYFVNQVQGLNVNEHKVIHLRHVGQSSLLLLSAKSFALDGQVRFCGRLPE